MNKVHRLVVLAIVAASSTALAVDWKKHPHLEAATVAINNAANELREANDKEKGNYGGHRDKAESLLKEADKEIHEAAEWAESHKQ